MINKLPYQDDKYISYAEYGNPAGFPVLVQHGMVSSIKDGSIFGDDLTKHARIICIARPGYGESSPVTLKNYREWGEMVSWLADKLHLTTFDVLASSAGAPYGYAVAAVCTGKVRNVYVYSGLPALYNEEIQAIWPYPFRKNMSESESKNIAYELFFAHVPEELMKNDDVRDSMMNTYFGVAQDLRIRFEDWGFKLSDVKAKVYLQHSKQDEVVPYKTVEITVDLLPDFTLELMEEGEHFSVESYQYFLEKRVLPNIRL